jgi:hypothetical protein
VSWAKGPARGSTHTPVQPKEVSRVYELEKVTPGQRGRKQGPHRPARRVHKTAYGIRMQGSCPCPAAHTVVCTNVNEHPTMLVRAIWSSKDSLQDKSAPQQHPASTTQGICTCGTQGTRPTAYGPHTTSTLVVMVVTQTHQTVCCDAMLQRCTRTCPARFGTSRSSPVAGCWGSCRGQGPGLQTPAAGRTVPQHTQGSRLQTEGCAGTISPARRGRGWGEGGRRGWEER